MHELSESASEQDVVVLMGAHHNGISNIAPKTLGIDHAEHRTPALATTVQQIVDKVKQTL